MDVLVPPILEEIVKVVKTVLQEQISERIRKQIVDVHVSQVVEQDTEVPKTSSRDRISQYTVERTLDVPVPEMVELPKVVSQSRIQQRTVEQIVDVPVPQAVKELAEVFRVFSQNRIQQRAVEQTMDTPATSLVEVIAEVPVVRTTEKTQQVANTLVQHVVNTVEVERPKIIKQTVQKPIIQEKIKQVTEHIEVPQLQFLNRVLLCNDRCPWSKRPWTLHRCRSWRKPLRPQRSKRSGALRPQRVRGLCLNTSRHRRKQRR